MKRLLLAAVLAVRIAHAADTAEMTPEDKRAKEIYLLARMGRANQAEKLAVEFLKENPGNRPVRLTLCAMYAADNRVEKLLKEARSYLALYPKDTQGLYYLASAEYQSGHYTESLRILRKIRALSPKGARDPYLVDRSASGWLAGEWPDSLEAHLELLRHTQLSPELRMEIRKQLDDLYRKHMDVAKAGAEYLTLDSGSALRPTASEEVQLGKRFRLETAYRGDDIRLKRLDGVADYGNYRQEGAVRLQYAHDTQWISEYTLGVSESDPLAKVRLDYELPYRRSWYAEGTAFWRATDSLGLEALDGRESRLETGGGVHLSETLVASAEAHVRRITVGSAALGDAVGGDWRLAKTVWQNGPSLIVSYRGVYESFSRSGEAVDTSRITDPAFPGTAPDRLLVPETFHRQGVDAEWRGHFGSAWLYRFFGSVDYDFVSDSTVYGAGTELTFRPRKSVEIAGRFEYQSAGTGGNAGSDALVFALTARLYH